MINWTWRCRKRSWPIFNWITECSYSNWGKPSHTSVSKVGARADIRTWHCLALVRSVAACSNLLLKVTKLLENYKRRPRYRWHANGKFELVQGVCAAVHLHHTLLTEAPVRCVSPSRPDRFNSDEKTSGTHWLGGCVGPRTGLDDGKEEESLPLPGIELSFRGHQSLILFIMLTEISWFLR